MCAMGKGALMFTWFVVSVVVIAGLAVGAAWYVGK